MKEFMTGLSYTVHLTHTETYMFLQKYDESENYQTHILRSNFL